MVLDRAVKPICYGIPPTLKDILDAGARLIWVPKVIRWAASGFLEDRNLAFSMWVCRHLAAQKHPTWGAGQQPDVTVF